MLDDIAKRFFGNLDLPGLNSVCLHLPRRRCRPSAAPHVLIHMLGVIGLSG
jgi:hypothetical protein